MRRLLGGLLLLVLASGSGWAADARETEIRTVIQKFQDAVAERNIARVERVVASNIVVLENGERNDGWEDFRDKHLVPEFAQPMPPSTWEFVRIVPGADVAWAYTKTSLSYTQKAKKMEAVLWSAFVLEKRGKDWKIALLDWSLKAPKAAATPAKKSTRPRPR